MKRTMAAISLCALLGVTAACSSAAKKDDAASVSAEKPSEAPAAGESTTTTTAGPASSTTSTSAPSSTTAPAAAGGTTAADFAAQANALCAKFNDQVSAVGQPTETTPAALGAYFDQALSLLDQQIAELKALSPPASISEAWAKVLQTIDGEQAKLRALVPRLTAGDPTALSEMQAISSDDINAQFDALGMTTCGSGSE